jgi:hypothetical protein
MILIGRCLGFASPFSCLLVLFRVISWIVYWGQE